MSNELNAALDTIRAFFTNQSNILSVGHRSTFQDAAKALAQIKHVLDEYRFDMEANVHTALDTAHRLRRCAETFKKERDAARAEIEESKKRPGESEERSVPTTTSPARCRHCEKPLDPNETRVADGCPCNSARGINHGLVPAHVCTCIECDPAQTGSVRPSVQDGREILVGHKVEKVGGDYTFAGIVQSVFVKQSGAVRYVVEDDRGVLHIYSDKNLRRV